MSERVRRSYRTVDYHVGGEPFRIVVEGAPELPGSTLAEKRLSARDTEELDAHRPVQASAWLTAHAERFPAGVFAVEREALQILAACERGPRNEDLARTFATRHPSSPLVGRLQRACGDKVAFSKSTNDATAPGERMSEPSKGEQR